MLWSSAEKWAKSAAAGFRPLGLAPNHPIRPLLCHIHGIFSKFRHLIKDYPGLAQNFPVWKLKCEKLAAFPTCDHFFPAVTVGGDNKWSVAGQEKTGGGLPHCPHCPSSTTPSLIIGLARWWVSLNLILVQCFSHKSVFRSAYVPSHDNRSLSIIELMSMNILSLIANKSYLQIGSGLMS